MINLGIGSIAGVEARVVTACEIALPAITASGSIILAK